jgi:hypothetical protein
MHCIRLIQNQVAQAFRILYLGKTIPSRLEAEKYKSYNIVGIPSFDRKLLPAPEKATKGKPIPQVDQYLGRAHSK